MHSVINGGGLPNRRTLAVMVEAPIPGKVKQRLIPPLDNKSAAELHECFILDAAEKGLRVPDAGLVLSCAPSGTVSFFRETVPDAGRYIAQRGKNSKAKLASAFRALSEPDHAVVCLSPDAPSLPARLLELAFDALDSGRVDVVIGPASRGGCYLVGMIAPNYEFLHSVPWDSEESLDVCVDQAAALNLGWYLLPEWPMIQYQADLAILKRVLLDLPQEAQFARHTRAFLSCLRDSGKL